MTTIEAMASFRPTRINSAHQSDRRASSMRSLISSSAPLGFVFGPGPGVGGAGGGGASVAMADCQKDEKET